MKISRLILPTTLLAAAVAMMCTTSALAGRRFSTDPVNPGDSEAVSAGTGGAPGPAGARKAGLEPAVPGEQEQGMGLRGRRRPMGPKLADELGLTAEQRPKFQAIKKEHSATMQKLRAERRQLIGELVQLVRARASDSQFSPKLDALERNRQARQAAWDTMSAALRGILTPTQQAKLVLWQARRTIQRGNRGGQMGPGRPIPTGPQGPAAPRGRGGQQDREAPPGGDEGMGPGGAAPAPADQAEVPDEELLEDN